MARIPFIPSSYGQGRSQAFESQRFINLYPELATAPGSKAIAQLVGTPGLRLWYANNSPPVRGMAAFNGLLYMVISNKLLSITPDGLTTAELGTLTTSIGRVSIKNNGPRTDSGLAGQLCIVDGLAGYVYDTFTTVFSTITGGGFPATPMQLEYIDGYFVVTNGSIFSWTSNYFDGTVWNALTQLPVQSASDTIQALINLHQQLFFIKQYTTEVYYNALLPTSSGSPFAPLPGAVIDFGTLAPFSVARGGNSVFFLANQRDADSGSFVGVVMLDGYLPVVISPPSITYRMSLSTNHSQCFGYCYNDEGHIFYVLTNPVDNWTFVYDVTTQMWHERSTADLNSAGINRHLSNCYVFFNNMHLVGDYFTSNLYEMSSKFYTDAGRPIISEQTTQHLADEDYLEDIFIGELKVDIEAGVGLDGVNSPATALAVLTGDAVSAVVASYNGADYTAAPTVILRSIDGNGSGATAVATVALGSVTAIGVTAGGAGYTRAPEVILAMPEVIPTAGLSISKDGGKTWGGEYAKSMGRVGEYRKRLKWLALGRSKDRVFKLRISSPVKKIILGYYVEVG
jgi:hypothetical protein